MSEIDYGAVLEDLERRRDELDAAINAVRPLAGLEPATPRPDRSSGGQLTSDAFFGLNIMDAVKKFLEINKRPARAADIARALTDGGLINTSKDFAATVTTTLSRDQERANGFVTRLPNRTWGLRTWYGARRPAAKDATETEVMPIPVDSSESEQPFEQSPDGVQATA